MNVNEIQVVLAEALPLRVPVFDPNIGARKKIELLEDYLMSAAWHRGQCEEALHWSIVARLVLRREWTGIVGYEQTLRGRAPHTKDQINAAKREIRPELWEGLEDADGLVESLGRQIRRLENDEKALSRVYTLITGSA